MRPMPTPMPFRFLPAGVRLCTRRGTRGSVINLKLSHTRLLEELHAHSAAFQGLCAFLTLISPVWWGCWEREDHVSSLTMLVSHAWAGWKVAPLEYASIGMEKTFGSDGEELGDDGGTGRNIG